MRFLRNTTCGCLGVLLALFVFTGDLVADAVCAAGLCLAAEESAGTDHTKDGCPACACAVHGGSALIAKIGISIGPRVSETISFANVDEAAPCGEPVPIDHPPQLS